MQDEVTDVKTTQEGKSKGFGVVRLSSADRVVEAIETMNGYDLEGRLLEVRIDAFQPGGARFAR